MLVVSTNKESKENYIGPAPLEEMARYDIPLTLALLDCTTETVTYGITALFNFLPKRAVFDHIQLAEGPAAVGKQYLFKLDYTVNKLGMVFAICHSSQRTYMLMFVCVYSQLVLVCV